MLTNTDLTALAERLGLDRPLAFLDIESTGTAVELDRIVELAIAVLGPGGSYVEHRWTVNPEGSIPPEATAIHKISDQDVAESPTFAAISGEVLAILRGCDIAGHGSSRFDRKMLAAEFKRAGVTWDPAAHRWVDTYLLFSKLFPRDLTAAVGHFCGKEAAAAHAEVAHGALADVRACIGVLAGQLDQHPELPVGVDGLAGLCSERKPGAVDDAGQFMWRFGEPAFSFGKHAGKSLREVVKRDPRYLAWMLGQDFSAEVKAILRNADRGVYPSPPAPAAEVQP
jgi:DNA polymerase-3 subunit epsilon